MILFNYLMILATVGIDARVNDYETPEYLRKSQREALRESLKVKHNHNIAKNVVLMIGDGMGVSTVAAARTFVGQTLSLTGEEHRLSFERWPAVGLSVTYNLDRQVADSAGTAVAFMSGVKVNFGTLGVDGTVPNGNDCSKVSDSTRLQSLMDHALAAGKSVGIVTTARITHATPGAAYAHTPLRDFENDATMAGDKSRNCSHVKDIALQLVADNPGVHVIMGGGRRNFHSNSSRGGRRLDGRDLIAEWMEDKRNRSLKHEYVDDTGCLRLVKPETEYLLGLFSDSHMDYEERRATGRHGQPALEEMAGAALKILQRNPRGYFLLLESGRIDHAHHDNLARLALSETAMFDKAIQKVTSMTSESDTLLTVTADHSHVFTISGYPERGNPILGTVNMVSVAGAPEDGLPYLTLSYGNGPNGRVNGSRTNYTGVDTADIKFQQPADVKMPWETHGGEDVAIYARGPMSHLFHSVHEQSYIAHVLMYAACIGDYGDDKDCDKAARLQRHHGSEANYSSSIHQTIVLNLLLLAVNVVVYSKSKR